MAHEQIDNAFERAPVVPLTYNYLLDGRVLDAQTQLRRANRNKTYYDSADIFKPAYICSNEPSYNLLFMSPSELTRRGIKTLPRNRLTPHLMLTDDAFSDEKTFESVILECKESGLSDTSTSAKQYFEQQLALINILHDNISKVQNALIKEYEKMNTIDWCDSYELYAQLVKNRIDRYDSIDNGSNKYKKYITMIVGFPRTTYQGISRMTYDDFMRKYKQYSMSKIEGALDPGKLR